MEINRNRRRVLLAAGVAGLGGFAVQAADQAEERVIDIVAKKFDYSPNEIRLRKGVPVVLAFTTLDVVMGFSAPDFKVRADIVPGKVSRLRFTPDKAGTFTFFCDIFCGSGHEDMTGTLIVSD